MRAALLEVDPDLPFTLRPMPEIVRESTVAFSMGAGLMSGFGALALALAALGLSGLLAYTVAQRRRELGVRLALGATPARLRRGVVGEGLRLVGVGAVAGIAGAVLLGRLLAAALPRAGGVDPGILAATLAIFAAVAVVASWVPARRGGRDAAAALRVE